MSEEKMSDEVRIGEKTYVPKDRHDRQVEVLSNIIGYMLRLAGQENINAKIQDLDAFGDHFHVKTQFDPDGKIFVRAVRRGVIPGRAMPTVPLGLLKRQGR